MFEPFELPENEKHLGFPLRRHIPKGLEYRAPEEDPQWAREEFGTVMSLGEAPWMLFADDEVRVHPFARPEGIFLFPAWRFMNVRGGYFEHAGETHSFLAFFPGDTFDPAVITSALVWQGSGDGRARSTMQDMLGFLGYKRARGLLVLAIDAMPFGLGADPEIQNAGVEYVLNSLGISSDIPIFLGGYSFGAGAVLRLAMHPVARMFSGVAIVNPLVFDVDPFSVCMEAELEDWGIMLDLSPEVLNQTRVALLKMKQAFGSSSVWRDVALWRIV